MLEQRQEEVAQVRCLPTAQGRDPPPRRKRTQWGLEVEGARRGPGGGLALGGGGVRGSGGEAVAPAESLAELRAHEVAEEGQRRRAGPQVQGVKVKGPGTTHRRPHQRTEPGRRHATAAAFAAAPLPSNPIVVIVVVVVVVLVATAPSAVASPGVPEEDDELGELLEARLAAVDAVQEEARVPACPNTRRVTRKAK